MVLQEKQVPKERSLKGKSFKAVQDNRPQSWKDLEDHAKNKMHDGSLVEFAAEDQAFGHSRIVLLGRSSILDLIEMRQLEQEVIAAYMR